MLATAIAHIRLFRKSISLILVFLCFIPISASAECLPAKPVGAGKPVVTKPVIVAPVIPLVPAAKKLEQSINTKVSNVEAKIDHNNAGFCDSQKGGHDISPNKNTNINNVNTVADGSSAKDHGLGSLVGHDQKEQHVVEAHVNDVQLSTGTKTTVDVHGDDLIHLQTDTSKTDVKTSSSCQGDHEHVDMTVHDIKQTLDNLPSKGDTVQAKGVSTDDHGNVRLHDGNPVSEENIPTTDVTSPAVTTPVTNSEPVVSAPTITTTPEVPSTVPTPVINSDPVVSRPTITTTPTVTAPDTTVPQAVTAPISTTPVSTAPTTPSSTPAELTSPSISNGEPESANVNNTPVINNDNPSSNNSGSTINANPVVDLAENTTNASFATPTPVTINDSNLQLQTPSTHSKINIPTNSTTTVATTDNNQSGLIVVGQVVKLNGTVTEVDENGQQHKLAVGENVHMGSKYIAQNGADAVAVVKYFNGEEENVLK